MQKLPDGDIRLHVVREKVKELIDEMAAIREDVAKLSKMMDAKKLTGGKPNGKNTKS